MVAMSSRFKQNRLDQRVTSLHFDQRLTLALPRICNARMTRASSCPPKRHTLKVNCGDTFWQAKYEVFQR